MEINKSYLKQAITNMTGQAILDVIYETEALQGGTVGEVCIIAGQASTK